MRRFTYWHEAILGTLLVALMVAASQIDPAFVSWRVQSGLVSHMGELALLAVPMTAIVITGGIDLSVGSTMALSAVALGLGFKAGWPLEAAVGLAVVVGTVAGWLNGLFVSKLRVHPLIVTLGTLSAFRGLAEGISSAQPVSGFPPFFLGVGQGYWSVGLALGAFAVVSVLMAKTPWGRSLYAIGLGEPAARFSGIPVDRIKLGIYTLSGFAASVAGILFCARRNTAKADIGSGLELEVVTAVVLGGTSIFGGRGTLVGTALGVLLIHETREFVSWRWSNDVLNLVVIGSLLILAVALNGVISRNPKGASKGG